MTSVVGTRSYAKQLLSPRWSSKRSVQDAKKVRYRSLKASKDSDSCACGAFSAAAYRRSAAVSAWAHGKGTKGDGG